MLQGNSRSPINPGDVKRKYAALKELGDCHAAVGETPAARQCYHDARILAPEETDAYVALGKLDIEDERYEQARRSFDIARRLDTNCAEAYAGLAAVYHQNDDYPVAFEMYLKCLELDTDNLIALLGLFQTSCQMGTFAKIIHFLEIYLDTHPNDTAVLFCLATLYARDGRLRIASKALRKVLDLEPDKIEAASLLSQVTNSLARLQPAQMAV